VTTSEVETPAEERASAWQVRYRNRLIDRIAELRR